MSFSRKQAEIYREDIIIEEQLWDVLKKYPKISTFRAIYILSEMIRHISTKADKK